MRRTGHPRVRREQNLFETIERKEFPQWEMLVQIMDDNAHPELEWDPLDDIRVWPKQDSPGTSAALRATRAAGVVL